MKLPKKKSVVLVVGINVWYVMLLKKWLELFCEVIITTSYEKGGNVLQCRNDVDVVVIEGYGDKIALAFKHKYPDIMVCLLTDDPFIFCNDFEIRCMQKPQTKRLAISSILHEWQLQEKSDARSKLIEYHLGLIEIYKTDPQDVEVLYGRLKRDFLATFESVALRHADHPNQTNFCITLQRGCPGDCVMCGTAKIKFHTTTFTEHEMAAQVAYLLKASYTAVGCTGEQIVIAAHGGGDPKFCLREYCNFVKIVEDIYGLNARYIATSIGGKKTWIKLFELDSHYNMSFEISAMSTNHQKRILALPAVKWDLPLVEQIYLLANNAAKFNKLYKYRHLLTKGFNDSPEEAKAIAKIVVGTPGRVIIQKMESGCFAQYPEVVTEKDVKNFMHMLTEEGVDVVFNENIGNGMVKCGMHITPQDRQAVENVFKMKSILIQRFRESDL